MKTIRLAFAIDGNLQFSDKNFSMADFFQFYEYQVDFAELKLISRIANPSLKLEGEEKYTILIDFLNENKIDLLVARNYSKKLKTESRFFVPVILDKKLPVEQICTLIIKHINWLIDELSLNKEENMVFNITNGIYKSKVDHNKCN